MCSLKRSCNTYTAKVNLLRNLPKVIFVLATHDHTAGIISGGGGGIWPRKDGGQEDICFCVLSKNMFCVLSKNMRLKDSVITACCSVDSRPINAIIGRYPRLVCLPSVYLRSLHVTKSPFPFISPYHSVIFNEPELNLIWTTTECLGNRTNIKHTRTGC